MSHRIKLTNKHGTPYNILFVENGEEYLKGSPNLGTTLVEFRDSREDERNDGGRLICRFSIETVQCMQSGQNFGSFEHYIDMDDVIIIQEHIKDFYGCGDSYA